jgi:hypothetical protein
MSSKWDKIPALFANEDAVSKTAAAAAAQARYLIFNSQSLVSSTQAVHCAAKVLCCLNLTAMQAY